MVHHIEIHVAIWCGHWAQLRVYLESSSLVLAMNNLPDRTNPPSVVACSYNVRKSDAVEEASLEPQWSHTTVTPFVEHRA